MKGWGWVVVFATLMVMGHVPLVRSQPAQCGPNAHVGWTETKGNRIIEHCQCNAGYTRYLSICTKAVCAKSLDRLAHAQAGGRSALITLRETRLDELYTKINRALEFLSLTGAGVVTREALYLQALEDADSGIDELLIYYKSRNVNYDLETLEAIKQVNVFRRLVAETLADMKLNGCDAS
jgi:hypothetical protein